MTSDPLWNLAGRPTGQPAGLPAIDLGRHNRARINGTLRHDACAVVISVERAYPDCREYIQRREGAASGGIFFSDPGRHPAGDFHPDRCRRRPRPQRNCPPPAASSESALRADHCRGARPAPRPTNT